MAKKSAEQSVSQIEREIQEFIFDRESRNLSKNTLNWYTNSLTLFRLSLAGQQVTETKAITPKHLRLFLIQLQRKHNEGGVFNIFGAVRAYLKWFASELAPSDWDNPLKHVDAPKRSQEVQQPIALDDFKKLLDTCKPGQPNYQRDRAMLMTLLDSGVRHEELWALTVGDVDLKSGAVLVRKGKGRKSRTTYIGDKTRKALTAYLRSRPNAKPTDPLWLTPSKKPLSKNGVRQVVARRSKMAGISEPGMHEFRRAFAINYLRNGGDVITLQRLLGHSNLSIINRYLALVSEDLRVSHSKFGVVDNLK